MKSPGPRCCPPTPAPRQRAATILWRLLQLIALVALLIVSTGLLVYVYNRCHNPALATNHFIGAVADHSAKIWVFAPGHAFAQVHYRSHSKQASGSPLLHPFPPRFCALCLLCTRTPSPFIHQTYTSNGIGYRVGQK